MVAGLQLVALAALALLVRVTMAASAVPISRTQAAAVLGKPDQQETAAEAAKVETVGRRPSLARRLHTLAAAAGQCSVFRHSCKALEALEAMAEAVEVRAITPAPPGRLIAEAAAVAETVRLAIKAEATTAAPALLFWLFVKAGQ